MSQNEELFCFTRGRFLVDGEANLASRYVRFDVAALGRIAAQAMGAESCTKVEKYSEGMYNKILLLTMDNGTEVIAKIPQPNAGFPERMVASEVATMEFVREILETPVSKVHAWSSAPDTNGVGAAYIVMDKCPGVQLTLRWSSMDTRQRTELLSAIAQIQSRWASVIFSQYGSLYYATDSNVQSFHGALYTDRNGHSVENARFAIGPSNSRMGFSDSRNTVEFYRGPWSTAQAYMEGLGEREIACVKHAARFPKPTSMVYGPGTYIPTREKKLRALDCYLELVKHWLPEESLCGAILWNHLVENIFVDANAPGKITAILDWQAAELTPMFAQVVLTDMSQYEGSVIPGMEPPEDPSVDERFSPEVREMGEQFLRDLVGQTSDMGYKFILRQMSSRPVLQAVEFKQGQTGLPLSLGCNIFNWGETGLANVAYGLKFNWTDYVTSGAPYPFRFTEQEEEEIQADAKSSRRAVEAMDRVLLMMRDIQFVGTNFMVSPGQYAQAKTMVRTLKGLWFQQLETERVISTEAQRREAEAWWPFDE